MFLLFRFRELLNTFSKPSNRDRHELIFARVDHLRLLEKDLNHCLQFHSFDLPGFKPAPKNKFKPKEDSKIVKNTHLEPYKKSLRSFELSSFLYFFTNENELEVS